MLLACALTFAIGSTQSSQVAPPRLAYKSAKVMVLGTYHMDNPGLDLVKTKVRDVLSEERQLEVKTVVNSLKRFRPTKVALESTDDETLNERYGKYLRGEAPLKRSETEQIGFRLAKELGHARVFAIDTKLDMDFNASMQMLAKVNPPEFQRTMATIQAIGPLLESLDSKYTVGEILAVHNDDKFVAFGQRMYIDFLAAHDEKSYPGADMVGDWYKRNLRIVSRLADVTREGDRVLVVFGSGHLKYMRDIIRDSSGLEFVSASRYLPRPPKDFKIPAQLGVK